VFLRWLEGQIPQDANLILETETESLSAEEPLVAGGS
jgi:hypothetical protein